MLNYTKGNLIDLAEQGQFNIIVQGCNCWNKMGSGIAKEIRLRYPAAAEVDSATKAGDRFKLGNYTVMLGKQFNIVNAYTQYNISFGADVFEYEAFGTILDKLLEQYPGCRFGFPMIGMGLARGDEKRIIPMIEQFALNVEATGGTATLVQYVALP